jgi:small GTP-binding protein
MVMFAIASKPIGIGKELKKSSDRDKTSRMIDPLSFRVVMVGDSEAGKTSIIHYLLHGEYESNIKNTVGAVFHTIAREVQGQPVLMQIWDTAGQERYRSIGPIYYRNAAAAIAVFDVTVHDFQPNLDSWIASVKRNAAGPLIYVVGNKVDLLRDETDVLGHLKLFAQRYDADSFLTSAKEGTNIDILFNAVFEGLVKARQTTAEVFTERPEEASQSDCCSMKRSGGT